MFSQELLIVDNSNKHTCSHYSVKINGISIPSEGWNSMIYPSVADWAHVRRDSCWPMTRIVWVGPPPSYIGYHCSATGTVLVYGTVLQLNCCTFKLPQVAWHQSQLGADNPALVPFSGFGSVWGFDGTLCPSMTFCDWHHNRTVPSVSLAPQTYDIMTS